MPHGKIILRSAAPVAKDQAGPRPGFLAMLATLAVLLTAWVGPASGQQGAGADEQLLKKAGVAADPAGLLAFFRSRTLRPAECRQVQEWIQQLGDRAVPIHTQAAGRLIAVGSPALPALRIIQSKAPPELARRAQEIVRKIESSPGPELPAAAARLLARHRLAEAVPVLLNYLPFADDETVEEQVLDTLGAPGIRQARVDRQLAAALHAPSPDWRAAAAYVLGQSGDLDQRSAVRRLLTDPEDRVRAYAASGLIGKAAWQAFQQSSADDEAVLRQHSISCEGPAIVDFLRQRSPSAAAQAEMRQLVRRLGDKSHRQREEASFRLGRMGPSALPFLQAALSDSDPEIARRASLAIAKVQRGPGPALPAAAIRLLARKGPPDAVAALLDYFPFAEDETVAEEALNTLCLLELRQEKLDPLLVRALTDATPARREAAAYVLGKVGTRADCAGLARLLRDPVARVRFRAVQGLLTARDPVAVPELIALLGEAPPAWNWQVDELVLRLFDGRATPGLRADASMVERKKTAAAWMRWWQAQKGAIDLARLGAHRSLLGLVLVAEYDTILGRPEGRVWEAGRDGKARWQLRGLLGPMDAQVLTGGRLLVAENMANRVTERDLKGTIHWEYRVNSNPIACQRLPSGNTFIATYNQLLEVTPSNQLVHSYGNLPGFYIFSARRLRNGHVLCMTAQGLLMEVDVAAGREVRRLQVPGLIGGWCSAEALPGGRYLIALQNVGKVLELDATGKVHWEAPYPGVFRATRLPNGRTLVVSMTTRRVAELDRSGAIRWEASCEGRPWQVHFR